MHLSKVVLENFQSHSHSEFQLDKNLNVIIGISNSGKTSLARALSLLLFNRWDKSWTKHGEKFCKITVTTSEGITVTREKGEKVNKYILEFNNGMQQVYENFGISVPEDVQKALGICEVQIDSTENLNLNLASQLDNLFLLSQTGSYRAKVLGKLSGATYLDYAIREINREKRSTVSEKTLKEKELLELQQQVDKLTPIETISTSIREIEAKLTYIAVQEARLEAIRSLFERVTQLKKAWIAETAKEALLSQIDLSSIGVLEQRVDKIKAISSLSSKIVHYRLSFEKQNKLQALLTSISLDVIPDMVQKVGRNKIIKELSVKLGRNQNELISKADELQKTDQQYQETTKQYSDMLRKAGVCPICGESTIKYEVTK